MDGYGNYQTEKEALGAQAKEASINNMLLALANPIIAKLMSEEELAVVCQVVKGHVVDRANAILEAQNKTSLNGMFR